MKTTEEHLDCAKEALADAESFHALRDQTRAVLHILFAIYGLMEEFNERDKRERGAP